MFLKAKTNSRQTALSNDIKELSCDEASRISGGDCQLVSISCTYTNGVAAVCEREYVCKPSK